MASLASTEPMPSTHIIGHSQSNDMHRSVSDGFAAPLRNMESTSVGFLMNSFLDQCLSEDVEAAGNTWGENNGRAITDIETLWDARLSLESDIPCDAREESSMMSRDEQQESPMMSRDQWHSLIEALSRELPAAAVLLRSSLLGIEGDANAVRQLAEVLHEVRAAAEVQKAKSCVPPLRHVQLCSRRWTLRKNQKNACPICLEKLSRMEEVYTLPCSHKLHSSCCNAYFSTPGVKPMCPICRFDMESYQSQEKLS